MGETEVMEIPRINLIRLLQYACEMRADRVHDPESIIYIQAVSTVFGVRPPDVMGYIDKTIYDPTIPSRKQWGEKAFQLITRRNLGQ